MSERLSLAVVNVNDPSIRYQDVWLETIRDHFEGVAAPTTELTMLSPDPPALRRADDTIVPYFMFLNNRSMLAQVREAAAEGVDGIFMACSEDPVLQEARTIVDVPVAGAAQATFHFASTFGHRFGIVIPNDDQLAGIWQRLLRLYGLSDRCVGVVPLDQPFMETFTEGWEDPGSVAAAIEDAADECIDDGAASIVLGSGGLSTMATTAGVAEYRGAPVFDVLTVGFKLLEARTRLVTELGLPPVSRAQGTTLVPEADRERVDSLFGLE